MTEFIALSLQGGREKVDGQRFRELTTDWNAKPNSITLSNKSFDCEAAEALVEYLNTIDGDALTILDMGDVIASRPEDEALAALRIMSSGFKRFKLVNVNVSDNAFGAKGIDACKDVMEHMPLRKLYVCNNGLSAEAVGELATLLIANTNCNLSLLHFYNNMSGTNGAINFSKILDHFTDIEDLRFSATRAGAEGCLVLAKSIGNVKSLKRLDLMDNTFGPQAAEELAKSLLKHTDLEFLNLRDDNVKSQGMVHITNVLKDTKFLKLKQLDISGNELNAKAVSRFAKWIVSAAPNLEELLVDDNEFGSEGALALAGLISQLPSLKKLSCSVCEISGNGGIAIAKALKARSAFNVNLNGNYFKDTALEKIQSLLDGKEVGEFDDNDEDADEDEEEEDESDKGEEDVDDLADKLEKVDIENE